jgi:hypothetical protein
MEFTQGITTLTRFRHTGVTFKVKNSSGGLVGSYVRLYNNDGSDNRTGSVLASCYQDIADATDGEVDFDWDAPIVLPAGDYVIVAEPVLGSADASDFEFYADLAGAYGERVGFTTETVHYAGLLTATESKDEENTTSNTGYSVTDSSNDAAFQTFPAPSGSGYFGLTKVTADVDNITAGSVNLTAAIYEVSGGKPTGSALCSKTVSVAGSYNGTVTFTFDYPEILEEGDTYALVLTCDTFSAINWDISTSNPYAGGTAGYKPNGVWTVLSGADHVFATYVRDVDATADLYFLVYGEPPLALDCTVGIQAANSGGGSAWCDTVCLLPIDEAAVMAVNSFAADYGFMVDALTEVQDVFLYKNDSPEGYGASLLWRSESVAVNRIGEFNLRPGNNRIMLQGYTPVNAIPGQLDYSGTYYDMWELPPGV